MTMIEHKKDNNYNNNNNRHTEPGVCISAEDGERIAHAYLGAIGPLNAFTARMIEDAIKQGLTVDNILAAIEQTAFAPRPSPAYLRAILRSWAAHGVSTPRRQPSASWWNQGINPALNYEQREYRNEDFEDDSYIRIAEEYLAKQAKEGMNEPQ